MEEQVKELNAAGQADAEGLLTLGRCLGRRQAFGMIANRRTGADAEFRMAESLNISREFSLVAETDSRSQGVHEPYGLVSPPSTGV
jgi:hypothetical protein